MKRWGLVQRRVVVGARSSVHARLHRLTTFNEGYVWARCARNGQEEGVVVQRRPECDKKAVSTVTEKA